MPTVSIQGVPHVYELVGDGPALVFIHGWLLSRHYWRPLTDLLKRDFTCLSYDLRGFGASQPTVNNPVFSLDSYAQDLAELLSYVGISTCWLVGHSLGASVALLTAAQFPERVAGVIGINAGGGIYLQQEFDRFRRLGVQLVRWRAPWMQWVPGGGWFFARRDVARPLPVQWGKQRLKDWLQACPQAAQGTLLTSTTEMEVHRLPQVVSQLTQPLYLVAGQKDPIMPCVYVRHLASFHPRFRAGEDIVWELPNCGHFAMLEYPELVAQRVRAWVNESAVTPQAA
ncbi:MAG: alpha/beta hydrolase [Gloeomargarita sp. SKYBB_i_bin120]|nr:alpha/beta hydrolase [Gloeomargarita sp. SKYG98]MCS7292661.1 alpha/beta hydrolase [Gloeomargarita sp. SKYB120]MDW8178223.1 alpha/beta hydrolase [Gloeomargarita sp. SKYBB_i_bin120]